MGGDGPIFVVSEPSEERFAAVRALAGDNASFVVIAEAALEALMNSKVFAQGVRRSRPASRPPVCWYASRPWGYSTRGAVGSFTHAARSR